MHYRKQTTGALVLNADSFKGAPLKKIEYLSNLVWSYIFAYPSNSKW